MYLIEGNGDIINQLARTVAVQKLKVSCLGIKCSLRGKQKVLDRLMGLY